MRRKSLDAVRCFCGWIALLLLTGITLPAQEAGPEAEAAAFFRQNNLLPFSPDNLSAEGRHKPKIIADAFPDHAELASRAHFKTWNAYEDEYLRFRYPADPLIDVVITAPDKEEPSDLRNYSIRLAGKSWLDFSARKAKLDALTPQPGGCMCGSVSFSTYVFRNGQLSVFGYLSSGELMDATIAGDNMYAALQWIHSPIPYNIYCAIVASLTLKDSVADPDGLRKSLAKRFGLEATLGFLRKGMTRQEVQALLGKPEDDADGSLRYLAYGEFCPDYGGPYFAHDYDLAFTGNAFTSMTKGRVDVPPAEGSAAWILEQAEPDDLPPAKATDLNNRLRPFFLAPDVTFGTCLQAAAQLQKKKMLSPELLPLIASAFQHRNVNLGLEDKLEVLEDLLPQESSNLIAARLELLLTADSRWPGFILEDSGGNQHQQWAFTEDLGALLSKLDQTLPRHHALLLRALQHPADRIRYSAFWRVDDLPPKEAQDYKLKGLQDPYSWIRDRAARELGSAGTENLPALEKALTTEQDPQIRRRITEAITRIRDAGKEKKDAPEK